MRKAYAGLIAMVVVTAAWFTWGCSRGATPELARGHEMFDTCQPCHGSRGAGNPELHAPPIAGLPEWYLKAQLEKFKNNIRGAHPDDAEGHRMRPMARTLYQAGDLDAVVKVVAAMPPVHPAATLTTGDRTAGEGRYAVCSACHGAAAEGNQDLGAPPLKSQADWYMVSQINKFKSGMRGAHPEDVTGQQMAAMSQTLEDSTAVLDVVAYIRSLQH